MRPVEAELFTGLTDDPRIENLPRASKGHLGLLSLSMHSNHDGTFMPPLMLVLIEATPLISKPFSKCGAFHPGSILSVIACDFSTAEPSRKDTMPSVSLKATFEK
jgi:hypothetical protein